MSDPLSTYLHDHLAGAEQAIDLVRFMRDQHVGEELGQFAAGVLVEIEADREVLRQIADRAGAGSSTLKELTAWFGEKVSRLKLRHDAGDGLGIFEALEFLSLGIHGKLALWRVLGMLATTDARLQGVDFKQLAARAETQHARVEKRRLQIAHGIFGTSEVSKFCYPRNASQAPKTNGKTVAGGVLLALAVAAAIGLAPDVVRYMKIRAM
jgi:hypothetical protein